MKNILTVRLALALLGALFLPFSTARAQGTAFTYQGRLNSGGGPAGGSFDLAFAVYDTSGPAGTLVAGPITNAAVAVNNGLFTVTLDFGAGVFTGASRWLEIAVRTNGGIGFTTLTPRQQITPTPYAMMAESASNLLGTLPAAKLTGNLPASQLSGTIASSNFSGTYSQPVSFNNGADTFNGTFFGQFYGSIFTGGTFTGQFLGDGSGLINLNAGQLASGTVPDARLAGNVARTNQVWLLNGNAGTTPTNNFLGTTDYQPLDIRVNGTRVLRLEPDARGAGVGSLIGGFPGNAIEQPGSGGDFIGGGGYAGIPNTIRSNSSGVFIGAGSLNQVGPNVNDSSIVGGYGNTILSGASVIGGGSANNIQTNAAYTTIGGGYGQSIQSGSYQATIGGGLYNVIQGNSPWSTIGGGTYHTIQPNTGGAVISGGYNHTIGTNSYQATIGGGYQNVIGTNAAYATIGGGRDNLITGNSYYATISGGHNNIAGNAWAVIAGGFYNTNNGLVGFIGAGDYNAIGTGGAYAFLGGGFQNNNNGYVSFLGGGSFNTVNSENATLGGGGYNVIQFNSPGTVLGGGSYNTIQANSPGSIVVGGFGNTNGGLNSFLGGGVFNLIQPNAQSATIPGGYKNVAGGNYSFAAGSYAQATHDGTFVWADSSSTNALGSTTSNQFLVRATGGARFVTGGAGLIVDNQPVLSGSNGGGLTNVNATTLGGLTPGSFATASGSTNYIQNQNAGPQTASFNVSGNATVGGVAQVSGLLRSGSEAGTTEPPSPAGLVLRRVNSINQSVNQIVARTDSLTLERDGTPGGFVVRYPSAASVHYTIAFQGMNSAGANVNFYTNFLSTGVAGAFTIYASAQNVVSFRGAFGRTFESGQHFTEVSFSRWGTDNFWSGTLNSTYNQ